MKGLVQLHRSVISEAIVELFSEILFMKILLPLSFPKHHPCSKWKFQLPHGTVTLFNTAGLCARTTSRTSMFMVLEFYCEEGEIQ